MSSIATGPASADLVDHLAGLGPDATPADDVIHRAGELGLDDAYRLQFALMERRARDGDTVAGYKLGGTGRATPAALDWLPAPLLGTLPRTLWHSEDEPFRLEAEQTFVEPEIAVLLGRDLEGPGVTAVHAAAAVSAYLPAFELVSLPPGFLERAWSPEHIIATHKTAGAFVIGEPTSAVSGLDLRLEGVVLRTGGTVTASATAVEVLGSPLNSVAWIANELSRHDLVLRAGMVVLTGSITPPAMVLRDGGPTDVRADFTHLGSVALRFARG